MKPTLDDNEGSAAHKALLNGVWQHSDQLISQYSDDPDPQTRAWILALCSAHSLTDGRAEVPSRKEVEALLPTDDQLLRQPLILTCHHGSLAAFVCFDQSELFEWNKLLGELIPHDDARFLLGQSQLALFRGDFDAVNSVISEKLRDCENEFYLEGLCVSSLCSLACFDVFQAIDSARKASQQARAGGFRSLRFLSGLVLARARRSSGRNYLAARILSAMEPQLPPVYRGLMHWELQLAGQKTQSNGIMGVSGRAANALRNLLDSAQKGDKNEANASISELLNETRNTSIIAKEADLLVSIVDPNIDSVEAPSSVRPYLQGEDARAPLGLDAVGSWQSQSGGPLAYVLRHSKKSRRILKASLGLVTPKAQQLKLTRLRMGRVDLACAILASHQDDLDEGDFFRACYGFRFIPELHEAVLSMLLTRVRERLGPNWSLTRNKGTIHLEGTETLLVPDPRGAIGIERQLLQIVAQTGQVTSQKASKELGASLRAVQEAVRRLVKEGEIIMDRSGRSFSYRLEDTSFGALTPAH